MILGFESIDRLLPVGSENFFGLSSEALIHLLDSISLR